MHAHTGVPKRVWRDLSVTVAILALTAALVECLFFLGLPSRTLILFYLLAALITARCTNGFLYAALAAVSGAFLCEFFVTEPRMSLSLSAGFSVTLLIMLAASWMLCAMTNRMKSQASLAQESEQRAELIHEINQRLLAARDIGEIARITAEYLEKHMMCPSVIYAKDLSKRGAFRIVHCAGPERDAELFHSEPQRVRAQSILKDPGLSDVMTDDSPVSYIPVRSMDSVLGLIGITGLDRSPGSDSFLQLLMGQVALVMELQYAFDQQQSIRIDVEREKMRGILLRAISHDLRTPLTGILSAGSIIEEQVGTLAPSDVRRLASDIKDNSEWLIRMVENLLAVTRISDGVVKVNKTVEVAEEIMAQSVSIVRKRFPDCLIRVKAAEDPMLVPMDAILITQVFINLLENAVKYSPPGSPVQLNLFRDDGFAQFEVSDMGRGIPDQIVDHLFETHVPRHEQAVDSVSGIGIGLSICKTIIDAHDGKITGHNKPDGGAIFYVTLPLDGG